MKKNAIKQDIIQNHENNWLSSETGWFFIFFEVLFGNMYT